MRADPDLPPGQPRRHPRRATLPAGASTVLAIVGLLAAWAMAVHG